ncbi:MAG: tetratricopeptide repeat protein [Planctomycetota bacterium]
MRSVATALFAAVVLSGCGKGPTDSATLPLSIPGPGSKAESDVKSPASATTASVIPQYTETVRQLLQNADSGLRSGRPKAAVEALSQAIGIMPEDSSLFRMRADVYTMLGENANARADYSTAIRLSPSDADLYNHRGYFLMSHALKAEAKADFHKAIELNPKHVAAYNNRGLLSLTDQDFKNANADFTRAIENDRANPDAWNNRGFARMKQGHLTEAMTDIREALKLNDKYINAWNNCGLIAMQQEDFSEAEKAFSRASELDPMDPRWLNHRKNALLKLNRVDEARQLSTEIEWLTELTALSQQAGRNAGNPNGWIARGKHLLERDRHDAAMLDFTRALAVSPGHPEALLERASVWLSKGDMQKAMTDCEQSLVSRPTLEAYSLRGDLWLKLDNIDQALSDFESARRFDEQVAATYELRAARAKEAGDTEKHDADMARAAEIRDALKDRPAEPAAPRTADGFDPDKG